jgi:hypothetical protein
MTWKLRKDPNGPLALPKMPKLPSLPKLPKPPSLPKLKTPPALRPLKPLAPLGYKYYWKEK